MAVCGLLLGWRGSARQLSALGCSSSKQGRPRSRRAGSGVRAGREWRPAGEPVQVEDHSFFFTGPDAGQAIPYGIYDLVRNTGWVNVGVDHDTSMFAVESIRRWWRARGSPGYPAATRLMVTADAGGSNGYRYRVWKSELATLAAETGLIIMVFHFPPGTAKWNKCVWPGG